MRCIVRLCLAAVLLLAAGPLFAAPRPSPRRAAHLPNVDVHVYRRCFTPDERVSLRVSVYNARAVRLSAHRLDMDALLRTSRDTDKLGDRLKTARPGPAAAAWTFSFRNVYPDQWDEEEVKAPRLAPGMYLIRATVGRAEKRTWLAVTDVALVAKRSRRELVVFAADPLSGRPVPGLRLSALDARGGRTAGATDGQGIMRLPMRSRVTWEAQSKEQSEQPPADLLWVSGRRGGSPAFTLSGGPPPPEPYAVYLVTDRPVYRPGHRVALKGTVRERLESDAPGGFTYRPWAGRQVTMEVRDPTDALVLRRVVTTNRFGSFEGQVQLASEPAIGPWQVVTIVGPYRAYTRFTVMAYRKPEYSVSVRTDRSHYLGGSTVPVVVEGTYYFGQPVANTPVRYSISFRARGQGEAEPPYQGSGVTDAKGQLRLDIRTQRKTVDRDLSVEATLTDLSRRSQSASGGALITAGQFRVSLQTDRALYRPGDRVTVTVSTRDYDDKPVPARVAVRLVETKLDRSRRPYKETTSRSVTTGADGTGTATFTVPRPGYLSLEAEAFDSETNRIAAQDYVWVAGGDVVGFDYPLLEMKADRASYAPGQTALVLLNTSLVGQTPAGRGHKPLPSTAWALVTVEGERIYHQEVVPLTARSTAIKVPVARAYTPSVAVKVAIVRERNLAEQEVQLEVPDERPHLRVTVTPEKTRYQPGEEARWTVTARDSQGRPAAAELSLGVVDASVYAILADETPDPAEFFWGGQETRTETVFSFSAEYSGGAFQTAAQARAPAAAVPPGSPSAPTIRVRRLFADTAYWNAFVETDADGVGHVTFTVPDNLTTWRATARAIGLDTRAGSATGEAVSTMPLIVRLEMPRFYVQGDQAVLSAVVHNYTAEQRSVGVSVAPTGAEVDGDARRTIDLAPGGQQRLDWPCRIVAASGSTPGTARVLVTADGGPGAQDAMELTLPVQPDGLRMVDSRADVLEGASAVYRQDVSALPPGATVTLTLSPSIASAVFGTLDYLTSYPYGCAEQTMSSFLPDVVVSRALRRLGVNRPVTPNLDQWVNVGLQKLYRYQHRDGGWHWWEFDQTDGDMTAYVLWGLLQARQAGYLVDDQRILRATECLKRLLAAEKDPSRRAEWLLTLAWARPADAAPLLPDAYKLRDKMDVYSRASLALALARAGVDRPQLAALAATMAQELDAAAVTVGTTAHWTAEQGGYSWRSDDDDVTARVLRALLTIRPSSANIRPAVRWLMGRRSGPAWSSTRTSAEVVFALTQFMEQTRELHPDYTASVTVDGQPVKALTFTPASAFEPAAVVTLTPEQLAGRQAIAISRTGAGPLYVTQTVRYVVPPDQAKPVSRGITVHRTYRVSAEDPSEAGTIPSGMGVEVQVQISADAAYRHAILEEPVPAGCEVASNDDEMGRMPVAWAEGGGFARQEVRDDRVVFYFDELPKGTTTVTYRLHAETPGLYRILPGSAWLMYFPEVRGSTGLARARVGERP